MDVNTEALIGGLFFLAYVVYGPLVKGGFWNKIGPTKAVDGLPLLKARSFSFV